VTLTVLNVAFPYAPVSADPVGGAEQVLAHIDQVLVAAGHRSIVIAVEGSQTAGDLVPLSRAACRIGCGLREETYRAVRQAIAHTTTSRTIDVIHLHGVDFASYLPPPGTAVVVSLHLPLEWYPAAALRISRPCTWLQPVSHSQTRVASADLGLLPPIENGVKADAFPRVDKRSFALLLGRVCPEKGFHEALDAAELAGVPLLLAGTLFPWPEHQSYFKRQIVPRLNHRRRWIGPVAGSRKRWLLAAARCVLVPSLASETSSLVAMEALAAGTPVIAYSNGALPDIVEHGVTGYIVEHASAMAEAIGATGRIDPEACRQAARDRFPLERSMAAYLNLYRQVSAASAAMGRANLELHTRTWPAHPRLSESTTRDNLHR
jgi:glycosyltransferase involved in cell wall biosynthesis